MKVADLVNWCLERQKEGKIFDKWTPDGLAAEINKRMNTRELVVHIEQNTILGAVIFHLNFNDKEVFIDNIVTCRDNVIWPMFVRILELWPEVDMHDWNFTGIHRSGRKRKFIVNKKLFERFSKI